MNKNKEQLAEEYVENKWKDSQLSDLRDLLEAPKNAEIMAFIAGFSASEPKWISVNDALPDKDQLIVIYRSDAIGFQAGIWGHSFFINDAIRNPHWLWMPLPKPPEK